MKSNETSILYEALDAQGRVIGRVRKTHDRGKAVYIAKSFLGSDIVSHQKSMEMGKQVLKGMLIADAALNQHSFVGDTLFQNCELCAQGATDAIHNVARTEPDDVASQALQQILDLTGDLTDEQLQNVDGLEDGAVCTGHLLLQARDIARKALNQ